MTMLSDDQQAMVRAPFARQAGRAERVGVEVEAGVVDPRTGVSRPYHGERGVGALLELIMSRWGGAPVRQGGHIVGLKRSDGVEIALESGCALEYASAPDRSLARLVDRVNADMSALAAIAADLDVALLSGAVLPFDRREDVHWAPKPRVPLMLAYFDREIGPGSLGWAAMAQIISIQTTLDYLDEEDLARKFLMANAVSPLVAALFANSPLHGGALTGALSRRIQIWSGVDPSRVGVFRHCFGGRDVVDGVVAWLLALPPIYRNGPGGEARAVPPGMSFGRLLAEGYGDGTRPGPADWTSMLATTWPYVRLRETLELRIGDGSFQRDWASGPALWVGLGYDRRSCEEALELMGGYTLEEHVRAYEEVAVRGLAARIGGDSVYDLCGDLVRIARDGLKRRVGYGLEPDRVLGFLDPLEEVLRSGATPAERLAARWAADPSPARYVQLHRYR
ncbi:glutamate--cysteine ligase [Thermocatellispora tengchongensis]|uniref:Glutamate--cysteine ligase n=1 Tax=Thermocatellispora tengchongensis TaxID=1073253 RepID=A0A840NYV5_9ACTN|nr:glutamate-cysteine ligase family protein [Thermocatellispora tengchongensis]MBB5131949.1 glutamate--cysteine ligase [Thermocatellispora tengchongensis]